jgi:hypothetical protein
VKTFSPSYLTYSSISRTKCATTGFIRHFLSKGRQIRGLERRGKTKCVYINRRMFCHHLLPKLLFTILLAVPVMSLWAQPKYEWLTTSNGLSQGYIYDIIQDKDGFMWFSTKAGKVRAVGVFAFTQCLSTTSNSGVLHLGRPARAKMSRLEAISNEDVHLSLFIH